MKNKVKRITAIKEIISTTEIGSQEELLHSLAERGFELTQGTLSRDMKQLKKLTISDGASKSKTGFWEYEIFFWNF